MYKHVDVDVYVDQKRVLEPLEPELQLAVSHKVCAENRTLVLCKSSKHFEPRSHLSQSHLDVLRCLPLTQTQARLTITHP